MKKTIITLVIGIFIASCTSQKEGVKDKLKYQLEEPFIIELEQDGVGGYRWEYMKIPEVVIVDSSQTTIVNSAKLAEYTKRYTLKGVKKGEYELIFRKKRAFEPDSLIPKENYRKIQLKIKK